MVSSGFNFLWEEDWIDRVHVIIWSLSLEFLRLLTFPTRHHFFCGPVPISPLEGVRLFPQAGCLSLSQEHSCQITAALE